MNDRDGVQETMFRYGRAVDSREFSLLASAFTDDAVIRYSPAFGDELHGLAALHDYLTNAVSQLEATQHMFTNFEVEVDRDMSRFLCYVQAQHMRAGGDLFTVGGRYDNRAIRGADGLWRMTVLAFEPIWTRGDAQIVEHVDRRT